MWKRNQAILLYKLRQQEMCVFKLWSWTSEVHLLQKTGLPLGFCSVCHVFKVPHTCLRPVIWARGCLNQREKETLLEFYSVIEFSQNIQDCRSETPRHIWCFWPFSFILTRFKLCLDWDETQNRCSVWNTGCSLCEALVLLGAHRGRNDTKHWALWHELTDP